MRAMLERGVQHSELMRMTLPQIEIYLSDAGERAFGAGERVRYSEWLRLHGEKE